MSVLNVGTIIAAKGIQIPYVISSNRPSNPEIGAMIYNITSESFEVWSGSAWLNTGSSSTTSTSQGAVVSQFDGYQIYTFTGTGSLTINTVEANSTAEVLVVGGGGSGGGDVGAGGGGGQVVYRPAYPLSAGQIITVTVGAGGGYPTAFNRFGQVGGTSSISSTAGTISAAGGGGGNGRSGGGASTTSNNLGFNGGGGSYDYSTSTPYQDGNIQSNRGGDSAGGGSAGNGNGGGGGAGGMGRPGSGSKAGDGGWGYLSTIDGTYRYYGGGGGGSFYATSLWYQCGHGGPGGGGYGGCQKDASTNQTRYDAKPNTGGGGGGGPSTGSNNNSGRGGSGVVIIRYKIL